MFNSRALGELPMVSVRGDLAAVKEVTEEQGREAVVLPGEAHRVEETIVYHYESLEGAPATREQGVEAFAPRLPMIPLTSR